MSDLTTSEIEEALNELIESVHSDGEVFFEEGEYDFDAKQYEREGYADTYQIGDRRIAVIE